MTGADFMALFALLILILGFVFFVWVIKLLAALVRYLDHLVDKDD